MHAAARLSRSLCFASIFAVTLCTASAQEARVARPHYPDTKKVTQMDDYHGTKVADPYRWLEDIDSPETAQWVAAENEVTFEYLRQIPQRDAIKNRLTALWNFERYTGVYKEGGHYFFSRNEGLQNQSVVWTADSLNGEPRVLIDPNKLSADGTVALGGQFPSDDGKYFAYAVAASGSDWNDIKVLELPSGKELSDHLRWIKFSGAAWTKDGKGFFYSRYDEPTGDKLTSVNKWPKVYYHTIGQPQSQDILIYDRPDQPDWGFGASVSDDGKYLVLSISQGTERKNRFFYRKLDGPVTAYVPTEADRKIRALETELREPAGKLVLSDPKSMPATARAELQQKLDGGAAQRADLVKANGNTAHGFTEMLTAFDAQYRFIGNDAGKFYFFTDNDAPRGRLITIDSADPSPVRWTELIPQTTDTLQGVNLLNHNMLVCTYLKDVVTQIRIHDITGKHLRDVPLPGLGATIGFAGDRDDTETFYAFTSFNRPTTVYHYDLVSGKSTLWKQPKVAFNPEDFEVKQVFYNSKDGTRVPMFITHRKGLKLDGANPTYLYGYGGFNASMTPSFSISNLAWMEMGGVYALANLRGGGEYGKDWHNAGRLKNKQNVFDDFHAAAEWLIANKYTTNKKLAIGGGSNGGLLVGACLTQRPDLYGACLADVGVMDMLRFHKATIGWGWVSDYGCSDKPEDFAVQHKYSPLHNIKPGTCYPPTLVSTGDHDDRVVPWHSFKFAAALQAAQACDNPTLIRIQTNAGHGAGKPTSKLIEEATDKWAFLVRNLRVETASALR
jgi:prolyl oligopeptidase